MAPSVASRPEKEAASRLCPNWYHSVLDWASPDEERDNPGKLDVLGKRLPSFHELRTRKFNEKSGHWTFAHAVHVARWEFHQAGYISTQLWESTQVSMRNVLLEGVIWYLSVISSLSAAKCTTFAQASAKFISDLENETCLAAESIPYGELKAGNTSISRWDTMNTILPKKASFLAAKFSSPTGALPESLLNISKCSAAADTCESRQKQDVNHNVPMSTGKVGDDAENLAGKDATRSSDASPSKTMSFDHRSLQLLINKTIDDRFQELKDPVIVKKRKLSNGHLDELIEAGVEKKLASYEVLLDDYTRLADHLAHSLNSFSDLPEKAAQLKQRRQELKTAVTPTTIPLIHEAKVDDDDGGHI